MLEQQLINALSLGSVYALFALGFTLIFGVLGVINLSHGAIFMLGSYAALLLVDKFAMPLWGAMLLAMLITGVLGVIVDFLVLRPLRKRNAPHLAPMIATIGVAIVITNISQGIFGSENKRFPFGTIPEDSISLGNLHLTVLQLAIILISFALMLVLLVVMRRTQIGRALRAIAESPKAAYLLGINVEGLFLMTSFAAAALGGAAGVLVGLSFNAITPFMGQPMLHKGIAVIILGGMGDIRGAMIGGLFLGFAEVLSVAYLSSDFRDAVAFGLLFLILLVRPSGMFGKVLERKA
jgi:branched-chain amino acid transport system permease protein